MYTLYKKEEEENMMAKKKAETKNTLKVFGGNLTKQPFESFNFSNQLHISTDFP